MPMSEAGKGHDRRPRFIPLDEWAENYERTFGSGATEEEREERSGPKTTRKTKEASRARPRGR